MWTVDFGVAMAVVEGAVKAATTGLAATIGIADIGGGQ